MTKISFLSIKKFFRIKSNITICILLSICMSFMCVVNFLPVSVKNYWDNHLLNNVFYRTYMLYEQGKNNYIKQILDDMPEVAGAYTFDGYYSLTSMEELTDEYNETPVIMVHGFVNPPEVVEGSQIDENNKDENLLICPNKFYPFVRNDMVKDPENGYLDTSRGIDLRKYLNKEITLASDLGDGEKTKFKLIGLYDTKNNRFMDKSMCFSYYSNVQELNKSAKGFSKDNSLIYELNKISDAHLVEAKLKELGYYANPSVTLNIEVATQSFDLFIYLSKGLMIIILLIILIISFIRIKKDEKNLMINKLLGYNNQQFSIQCITNSILTFIVTLLISMPLIFGLWKLFQIYLPQYDSTFSGIKILFSYEALIKMIILLALILVLITIINIISKFKKNLINIIKS